MNYSKTCDVYVIIGSYIESEKLHFVEKDYYKNNICVANSEYERMLFNGFLKENVNCYFISAPIVGRWPFSCKRIYFKRLLSDNIKILYCSFCTLFLFINFFKFLSIKNNLKKIKKMEPSSNLHIICSEMHWPYLKTIAYAKKKISSKNLCIVPDLPEFMLWSKNPIYRFFKNKDISKCYLIANEHADSFLFFTPQMIDRFNVNDKKFLVREGIIEKVVFERKIHQRVVCTFIGKIDKKNGIDYIVEMSKRMLDVDFYIYGSGELESFLINVNQTNLFFKGFVSPDCVDNILLNSDILLSPRYPFGEYLKYSFPSKILKYISTNKPIVTFKLPCYEEKYDDLLIFPQDESLDALIEAVNKAKNMINIDRTFQIKNKLHMLFNDRLARDILDLTKI